MSKIISNKILVTKSFLPPFEEYTCYLKRAWDKRWITNQGELALELEDKLKKYLNVKHAFFVSNGTIAIQLAIKALDLKGEIITTPFTFAATTSTILWEKCKPVFVDINPETFTIDADKIEKAITKDTKAILAVHVYGYPCDVEKIEYIANKYNLKVIYDAAHAFGIKINKKSIFQFGNISTLSLHATKLFHTVEGGLITTNDDELAKKIELFRDFGLEGENPVEIGINAKNSEFHAAMGLANFNHLNEISNLRRKIVTEYRKLLFEKGIHKTKYLKGIDYNNSYFPVVFKTEEELLLVKANLAKENIFSRRYFYPSLNTLPFVKYTPCPISETISRRVLCLPLYHDLPINSVRKICSIIKSSLADTKPTLSVGIPSYNEEANIIGLIHSVLSQKQSTFILKEIIVNSDGSDDNTSFLVRSLSKKYPKVSLIENRTREGKPYRLNQLYELNLSDYILTLDSDVLLKDKDIIEQMLNIFQKDNQAKVVAAHLLPLKSSSFFGKIIYTNNLIWDRVRAQINNGDHITNLYGAASMLKKDFSKSFKYPSNISCDEEYLYVKAKESNGFRYASNAYVYFRVPETLREAILQGRRALKERYSLVDIFGKDVLKLHDLPIKPKILEPLKMLLSSPLYTSLSILFNIFLRFIPYEDKLNKKGKWKIATSTKRAFAK